MDEFAMGGLQAGLFAEGLLVLRLRSRSIAREVVGRLRF
jgi:hypothetical protein